MNRRMRRAFALVLALALVVVVILAIFLAQQVTKPGGSGGTATPTAYMPTGMLHVEGAQIIDASGHPIVLRGAQIESPFNYIKRWERGDKPSATLNSTVFDAMVHDWKMNVLRLPISNWMYASSGSS